VWVEKGCAHPIKLLGAPFLEFPWLNNDAPPQPNPLRHHRIRACECSKNPNRRLYDTETSTYITLADVKKMVMDAENLVVRDAKTSEDLTRTILLQVILEEESGGLPMFSTAVLAQIIRFYGHAMQGLMGVYLEKNMQAFAEMQACLTEQAKTLSPEVWTQFIQGQAPTLQGWMSNYFEQSQNMFQQIQEQMSKQAETLFPGLSSFHPPKK
jgi:polyhydroxyalkanoate synthesis repressor PhaR